jgi:CelD/BcsL family acetyltransferase involved in cellulose biosynthesis
VTARWGPRADFHREFAALALERAWLRLWTLELDDRPVAAWYGFRFDGVEYYYQAGRDPGWDHASVGFVLLSHTIRSAFADGIRSYRFLRGGEGYKYRFANRDDTLQTIMASRTTVGHSAAAAALALRNSPRPVRHLVRDHLLV